MPDVSFDEMPEEERRNGRDLSGVLDMRLMHSDCSGR